MRIPEDLLNTTVFLGGRDSEGELHYRATAVGASFPTECGNTDELLHPRNSQAQHRESDGYLW